jgi:hypothetical protein
VWGLQVEEGVIEPFLKRMLILRAAARLRACLAKGEDGYTELQAMYAKGLAARRAHAVRVHAVRVHAVRVHAVRAHAVRADSARTLRCMLPLFSPPRVHCVCVWCAGTMKGSQRVSRVTTWWRRSASST